MPLVLVFLKALCRPEMMCSALARLWTGQGKTEPARALLSAAYERLTEGFATVDMTEARRLLDELAVARVAPATGPASTEPGSQ